METSETLRYWIEKLWRMPWTVPMPSISPRQAVQAGNNTRSSHGQKAASSRVVDASLAQLVVTISALTKCQNSHHKASIRQSKSNLRTTVQKPRRQQASHGLVINALSHSKRWKDVLCQVRSGRSVEAIADWLVRQLPLGAGGLPSLSHLSCSGADASLANLALFADVGDALFASIISDEAVSASTCTGGSISSEPLVDSRYSMDTSSQWSQYLDASQTYSNRSPSQPATESSRPFNPRMSADDLAAFWANSVPFPVEPSPTSSSAVASSGD